MKKENIYSRDDAYKSLENINSWINNCDTKTSIILALFGVILTMLLTNSIFINQLLNILHLAIKGINFSNILYLFFIVGSIVSFLVGAYKLIQVLSPKINFREYKNRVTVEDSIYYFGKISCYGSFNDYRDAIKSKNDKEVVDDLISQIYINSIICQNKFVNFKGGLKLIQIGLSVFTVMFILGLFIF